MLIDGKAGEFFTPVGSTFNRYDGPFGPQQVETDTFKVTRADIENISHASSLQFRLMDPNADCKDARLRNT